MTSAWTSHSNMRISCAFHQTFIPSKVDLLQAAILNNHELRITQENNERDDQNGPLPTCSHTTKRDIADLTLTWSEEF